MKYCRCFSVCFCFCLFTWLNFSCFGTTFTLSGETGPTMNATGSEKIHVSKYLISEEKNKDFFSFEKSLDPEDKSTSVTFTFPYYSKKYSLTIKDVSFKQPFSYSSRIDYSSFSPGESTPFLELFDKNTGETITVDSAKNIHFSTELGEILVNPENQILLLDSSGQIKYAYDGSSQLKEFPGEENISSEGSYQGPVIYDYTSSGENEIKRNVYFNWSETALSADTGHTERWSRNEREGLAFTYKGKETMPNEATILVLLSGQFTDKAESVRQELPEVFSTEYKDIYTGYIQSGRDEDYRGVMWTKNSCGDTEEILPSTSKHTGIKLGWDKDTIRPSQSQLGESVITKADQREGLDKNTVYFFNQASSPSSTDNDFEISLINKSSELGYTIVSSSDKEAFLKENPIALFCLSQTREQILEDEPYSIKSTAGFGDFLLDKDGWHISGIPEVYPGDMTTEEISKIKEAKQ